MGVSFASSKPPKTWVVKPSLGPSTTPAPSPLYQGPSSNPSPICVHHHHHQHVKPDAIAPSPSKNHVLTSDRFWHKKVPLNTTLFSNYEVLYISYLGIPSSPPYGSYIGNGPTGSVGDLPIIANFINKN
nr:receptor-like serine/threonine-protein kinase ale2 [Quercus suber]